ncbi:MAG: NAD(P)H-dependent oxidoreductase subunit E [Bacteroidales bacterium]|nr:NAD(P)H-dependent oxidoreductase subunit E [Bacteroidales bacterium]
MTMCRGIACCVGACGLAPVALVNGKVYGRLASANVKAIVNEYREMDKQ